MAIDSDEFPMFSRSSKMEKCSKLCIQFFLINLIFQHISRYTRRADSQNESQKLINQIIRHKNIKCIVACFIYVTVETWYIPCQTILLHRSFTINSSQPGI